MNSYKKEIPFFIILLILTFIIANCSQTAPSITDPLDFNVERVLNDMFMTDFEIRITGGWSIFGLPDWYLVMQNIVCLPGFEIEVRINGEPFPYFDTFSCFKCEYPNPGQMLTAGIWTDMFIPGETYLFEVITDRDHLESSITIPHRIEVCIESMNQMAAGYSRTMTWSLPESSDFIYMFVEVAPEECFLPCGETIECWGGIAYERHIIGSLREYTFPQRFVSAGISSADVRLQNFAYNTRGRIGILVNNPLDFWFQPPEPASFSSGIQIERNPNKDDLLNRFNQQREKRCRF